MASVGITGKLLRTSIVSQTSPHARREGLSGAGVHTNIGADKWLLSGCSNSGIARMQVTASQLRNFWAHVVRMYA